jgi:BCD family chlorophyll transporter-like MFS transporter
MGGGLFSVATLTMAMAIPVAGLAGRGLALGAWGAAQATAAGLAILMGGALRDVIGHWAKAGHLGAALQDAAIGYSSVYLLEIGLLFATLIVLGPLVRTTILSSERPAGGTRVGLADFPT